MLASQEGQRAKVTEVTLPSVDEDHRACASELCLNVGGTSASCRCAAGPLPRPPCPRHGAEVSPHPLGRGRQAVWLQGLCPGSTSNPRWSPRPLGKRTEGTQTPGAATQNGESARGPDRAEPAWTYLGHRATFTRTAQWSGRARSRRCARMAGGLVLGPGTRLGPVLASFRTQRCTSSRAPPATGGPARSRIPLCPGAWPGAPSCTVVVGCVALCCRGPAAEPCVHASCRRRVGACCPWSCRVHAGSGTVTGLPQLPQTPGAGARPLLPPSLVTAWEALPGADTRCRGVCPCTRAAPGAAARLVAASRGRRWPAEPDTGSALPGPCPPPLLVPEITFEWPVRGSPCDLHCVPLGSRDKRKAKL